MLQTELYIDQVQRWPKEGQHILAQFNDEGVVVYQAYRPAIGHFAAEHQYFGGEFKMSRMSWIKPNFLWMMYRCGWGMKPDQEVILAVTIRREASGFRNSGTTTSRRQLGWWTGMASSFRLL